MEALKASLKATDARKPAQSTDKEQAKSKKPSKKKRAG
jgi:hypothetical protein